MNLNPSVLPLPLSCHTSATIRLVEAQFKQHAPKRRGPSLMDRAGMAALACIQRYFSQVKHLIIVSGRGNNGGDGFALAKFAHQAGMRVSVYLMPGQSPLSPESKCAKQQLENMGLVIQPFSADLAWREPVDLLVDALLGIGCSGPLKPSMADAVRWFNTLPYPVLSLDCPSGVNPETGHVCDQLAVKATHTLSFIALKLGLLTGAALSYTGVLSVADLGLGDWLESEQIQPAAWRLDNRSIACGLQPRKADLHKHQCGHVVVIGGDQGMAGAVILAAKAALRAGAGLVTVLTHPDHPSTAVSHCPELIAYGLQTSFDVKACLSGAQALILGPGLRPSQSAWSQWVLEHVQAYLREQAELPVVLDAGGLTYLSQNPWTYPSWVLTPHPGEAGCLLGCDAAVIQSDRLAAVHRLQAQYQGVVVLKGAGTLIALPETSQSQAFVCHAGNPGMATAGMGDVLTGVIAALIAQGLPFEQAALLAVVIHAEAGDQAARVSGQRGLMASDVLSQIQNWVNP